MKQQSMAVSLLNSHSISLVAELLLFFFISTVTVGHSVLVKRSKENYSKLSSIRV